MCSRGSGRRRIVDESSGRGKTAVFKSNSS